jgi:NADH dehydrogenase/NADH:ubiquinone oxidoreductase subunit G
VAVGREIACAQTPVFILGKGLAKGKSTTLKALEDLCRVVKGSAIINTRGKANSAAAQKYGLDQAFLPSRAKAVYIALGDDTPSERLITSLMDAPFVAVQASYSSSLTDMAEVVFPVETCFEQEGHFMNLDERVQKSNRATQAPEGVKSNLDVLKLLAHKMDTDVKENWQDLLAVTG